MKVSQNRVVVHKSFTVPMVKTLADGEAAPYPTQLSTSNTLEVTHMTDGNSIITVGTVANATDTTLTLNPIWSPNGPIFEDCEIRLEDIQSATQMFVRLVQDNAYVRCSPTATQYTFSINGHQIDADSERFMKVAIVADPNARTRKGEPKKQTAVYGYIVDAKDNYIIVDAMEFVRGDVRHFTATIDLDDLLGIFRYKVEVSEFVHRDHSNTKAAETESTEAAE